jgi:hypothetical protein
MNFWPLKRAQSDSAVLNLGGQIARDGQCHADHAALAGGVRRLADLAVVGGHAGAADLVVASG